MLKEFKTFIMRGNVIDMAVGVVVGAAFKAIVDSLVGDIIMPIVGVLTAGIDFKSLKAVIRQAEVVGEKVVKPEVAIMYGNFVNVIINFLIIAFCIFMVVKGINVMRSRLEKTKEAEAPAGPSEEVLLLREIASSLKKD